MTDVSLSLVAHTNVGKTTLARTLLGRDVGQVRDEAHVTEAAESHDLVRSANGDRLLLWDTPGFGDSLRLARRMAQAGNPLGWLLTEVWDRWRDRAFWHSQRALRHACDEADVLLYLVDAGQAPADMGYLDAELQILALARKPALVLLNQLGAPGAGEGALEAQWRARLGGAQGASGVRGVLALDAFSRCWVQEGVLWRAVAPLIDDAAKRAAFERLAAAWHARQHALWQRSMAELARRLARAAADRERAPAEGWRGALRGVGAMLARAVGSGEGEAAAERAMAQLAERLDDDVRASTDRLIEWHGLDGRAGGEVLARLARHYARRAPIDEGRAALWGGAVTGALAGLKADIASGGLTLGGGLLAGGVLGALAAAGAARGVNRVRGLAEPEWRWDTQVLDALSASALLGYLAVAHHGRGRGAWMAEAPPAAWVDAVAAVAPAIAASAWPREGDEAAAAAYLAPRLEAACGEVLARLYPDAPRVG